MDLLIPTLFIAGYIAFLLIIARNHWRFFSDVKASPRTKNFRITDIWAAILALTPSLLLIGKGASSTLAERPLPLDDLEWSLATAAILSGQALGIYIGRAWSEVRCRDQQFESAVLMISTGLMGAVLPVVFCVIALILTRVLNAAIEIPVIGGALLVVFLVSLYAGLKKSPLP